MTEALKLQVLSMCIYIYILLLIDTFSRWLEAFPCHTNMGREVVKHILKQVILQYGIIPAGLSLDGGLHFVAEVIRKVGEWESSWDLHTLYRPQARGKVERMTQTL